MAKFRLTPDAQWDLPSTEETQAMFERLGDKLLTQLRSRDWPSFHNETGSAVADATGVADVRIPGPKHGFGWHLRTIAVTGVDATASIGGVATFFRNEVQPSNFIDRTTSIPAAQQSWWDPGMHIFHPGEMILVRFTGVAAAITCYAVATIQEFKLGTED